MAPDSLGHNCAGKLPLEMRSADATGRPSDPEDITLAGAEGYALALEIALLTARMIPAEDTSPRLSRRADGSLQLRVSPATLEQLGR